MPKLRINDTDFTLKILEYRVNGDDWVDMELKASNKNFFYENVGELMTCEEVDRLIYSLHDLLDDKLTKTENLSFAEPDLTLELIPTVIDKSNHKVIYGLGHETYECRMRLHINLTDGHGVYIGDEWITTLDREEIETLLDGLETELGKKVPNEERIRVVGVFFKDDYDNITWYIDEMKETKWDKFVYVPIGKDEKPTLACVELIRNYYISRLPFPLSTVKRIIRVATEEETDAAWDSWGWNN